MNAVVGIPPRSIPIKGKASSRRTWHVPPLATECKASRGSAALVCWDCRFESHRNHGWFFPVSVVFCKVKSLRRARESY